MPTMSSSTGPAFCRRSARSRNVSESSDASWTHSEGNKSTTAGAEQQPRCPMDVRLSENSPDRVKRKKRRKNVYALSIEERNKKVIKKRVAELSRRKKQLEKQLAMVKFDDNRIPIVLLTRLDHDHHSQPKLEVDEAKREKKKEIQNKDKSEEQELHLQKPEEQKQQAQKPEELKLQAQKPEEPKLEVQKPDENKSEEQRVHLPGLNIPAKLDLAILKRAPVVKINKKQTESLIEITRRRQQRKLSPVELDDVRKEENGGRSVADSDVHKCADKLTEKLDNCSSNINDHKCTKNNPIVSNSGRRHVRLSVDKGSNNRLPDKLLGGNSKSALQLTTEMASADESQPECSKSFVPSSRKLRRYSVDQNYDKQFADSVESKPKCADVMVIKHSESSSKDAKKYSKNLVKDNEKHSCNTTDKGNRKRTELSGDKDENTCSISDGENRANQSETPRENSRKILKNFVEFSMRSKRNSSSKEQIDNPVESSCFKSSSKCNEKIFEKMDKNIQDLKNRIETRRITMQKVDDNDCFAETLSENNADSTETFIKGHDKKNFKISDKLVDECTKNETENKRFTRKTDDKILCGNLIENNVNFVEPPNSEPDNLSEKLDKNNKLFVKIQSETKRCTRSISDKNNKHLDDELANNLKLAQNITKKIDKNQSQVADKDIQKCSINLPENKSRARRNSEKPINVVEEKNDNLSENFDKKVNVVSEKCLQTSVKNKIQDTTENISEKDSESSGKSNKKFIKNIDAVVTIEKIPSQNIKMIKKISEIVKENDIDSIQSEKHADIDRESEKLSDNSSEVNQRPRRKIVKKKFEIHTEAENFQTKEDNSVEKHNERLMKNLSKNIDESCIPQTDTVKRRTRKISDKISGNMVNSEVEKVNQMQEPSEKSHEKVPETLKINIQQSLEIQTAVKKKRGRPKLTEKISLATAKNKTESDKLDKMITRHSLNSVIEKQNSELITNIPETTKISIEDKVKIIFDETEKIKESNKIETEHQRVETNLLACNEQNENDSNKHDSDENKEKISDELHKNNKRDSKIYTKMVTRNSSPNKQEKNMGNLMKSKVNCLKNEEKISEESQKVIKENSKSQVENSKRSSRKLLPDKHDRLLENLSKKNINSNQNILEKNEMKVSEESQKIIKECSKSQTENNKKVIRKSSPDKHGRHVENLTCSDSVQIFDKVPDKSEDRIYKQQKIITESSQTSTENTKKINSKSSSDKHEGHIETDINNLDNSQNSVENNNENLPEELHKVSKDCFKTQIENNKRITNKSITEKCSDTLAANHLDSQNSIDEDNEILSGKLDDKENSKIQMEIPARITRNTTLRKDKSSKNLAENNTDFVSTLVDENKEKNSDHIINNVKVFSKNLTDKKVRKYSVDKSNEINTENSIENSTNSIYLQNTVEESNEKQFENYNQNFMKHSKDFIETRRSARNLSEKNVTEKPQIVIQSSLQRTQHSIETSEEKHSSDTADTTSNKIPINIEEDNKKITQKSSEKICENEIEEKSIIVQNSISEFHENEKVSKNAEDNTEKDDAELTERPSKNFNEQNVENSEHLAAGKSIKSFQQSFEKFMQKHVNEAKESCKSNSSLSPELTIRCSKRIALKAALKNNGNQSELSLENMPKSIDNPSIENLNENKKQLSEELNDLKTSVTQHTVDEDIKKIVEKLVTDSSKAQENSVDVKQLILEESNESLKNSTGISEDAQRTTRSSVNKRNQILSESLVQSNDVLLSNQVEEIHEIHSHNANENEKTCTEMFITDCTLVESENIDKSNEISSHITFQSDSKTDNNLNNDKINDIKNSSRSNAVHQTDVTDENVKKSTAEKLVDHDERSENLNLNETSKRREITLKELGKKLTLKSTENRENLETDSDENQTSIIIAENHVAENLDLNASLESNKTPTEPWSDSCAENATESDSFSDSDETLAGRLAKLGNLEIPSMERIDPTYQSETEEKQKCQPAVEKLVLRRCPQASFYELNTDLRCKSCDKSFFSNRELKKHIKVKHRQRLVIKITKTEENKHVTQMVESLLSPVDKQAEMHGIEDTEEERDSGISTSNADTEDLTSRIDERPADELTDGQITEGEIKIIVRKESGSRNSHVVKEIKITPKSSEGGNSTRLSNCSPAKSDLSSGSSSHRTAGWSPARVDLSQPVPKKRGRPRKYPIFTEAELVAKQTAAAATLAAMPSIVNNGGFLKKNVEELFTPVESIVVQPDISFNVSECVTIEKNTILGNKNVESSSSKHNIVAAYAETKVSPLKKQINAETEKSTVRVTSRAKRKRTRTLSSGQIVQISKEVAKATEIATEVTKANEATEVTEVTEATEAIAQEEKRPKLSEDTIIEQEKSNRCSNPVAPAANEQDLSVIYGITKELVVRLTKIDSVPKNSKEFNADIIDSERSIEDSASTNVSERPKRRTKPRLAFDEEEAVCREPIKSVIRLNQRNKLENNNNNLKEIESGSVASSSPKRYQKAAGPSCTQIAIAEPVPEAIEQNKGETQGTKTQQPDVNLTETINNLLDENVKTGSESEFVMTPKSQTVDKAEADESQKAKLMMLMNATTPNEANNVDTSTIVTESPHPQIQPQLQSPPQSQVQPQPQSQPQLQPQTQTQPQPQPQLQTQPYPQLQLHPQLQLQQPQQLSQPPPLQLQTIPHQIQCPMPSQPPPLLQQQFCILFIPDALYTSDANMSKEATPTATIVNFQPVPDAEIANKPLIYTPTTPTKISTDEHAKAFVCTTCAEISDLVGRLEASLGMTEEDKSAIKCPYCSNHFQSLFYLEYHVRQEHLKCENEKQCRHSGFNSLRIPTHEAASEFEIYITFALKCRSCYDIFNTVLLLNDHVMNKHKTLVRLRPSLPPLSEPASPATSSSASSVYASPFAPRKNGSRPQVFQCPSDCVCRIGIRTTDTPLQRQQMLKRCPNAMRRLEKIEPAAYEVYTCTLCKSTFLMKDEVVDHLMKMHEVSCKFPCYTCLTSFRTLQLQENHRCSETTLQDIDKLLSVAILPTNVSGKTDNKYLEREDSSSTDEYGTAIKGSKTTMPLSPTTPPPKNGIKRKNGATIAALNHFLGVNAAKKAKLTSASPPPPEPMITNVRRKRNRLCPKCKKRFAYRKSLHDHIIHEHILKGEGNEGPKKMAVELLRLLSDGRANGKRIEELAEMLSGYTDQDGVSFKSLMMLDQEEEENCEDSSKEAGAGGEKSLAQCARCKSNIKLPSDNLTRHNNHQKPSAESGKFQLCENCESSGPKTRGRRNVMNNGHHLASANNSSSLQQAQQVHPFSCRKCLESFPSTLELKAHKRNAHGKALEKQFVCDICKKSFASLRMLDKHKKIHREAILDQSAKAEEDDSNRSIRSDVGDCSKDSETNDSLNDSKANSSSRRDSSDSSSGVSKEPEKQRLNCSFCEEVCSSKVSLKNHLKREHARRASICQFCNSLLVDTSEVRHMLDYHIVPSKSSPRRTIVKGNGSILLCDEVSCMEEDVEELIRTLGKQRLSSLMIYHDFEGKCNNAIMRCPICPELFATRESCRFHYVWIHDDNCLLCDETFRSGSIACQHKVEAHTSTASYLWCIQRLVTAIVNTLRLDPNQPSHVLYQILAMRLEDVEQYPAELQSMNASCVTEKGGNEEAANATDRFLEEVVLSEDQLPDSGNMIEVVIGKEDSEDDLLSMLNLSPNYESCEQRSIPNAGSAPPEEEEEDDIVIPSAPTTPPVYAPVVPIIPASPTPTITTTASNCPPAVENYVTSGVCKYKLDNDEEQLVLVVTDEDLVTFRDDIRSLAERISATCDSLTLEEITEMLRAYFESVNANSGAV